MKKIFTLILIINLLSCNSKYEKRKDKVYYVFWSFGQGGWNESIVGCADILSFSEIKTDYSLYGKDKYYVYFQNKIIPGADPETFKHLKKGYAIDKNRAYYYSDSITNSGSRGFEIIDGYFSKDSNNVYYTTTPLNVCSLKNFEFVFKDEKNSWQQWSKDGCFYYFNNIKIPSNDYDNIIVFKGSAGIAKDRKYVYQENRNILYNQQGKRVIDTIDIKTFEVDNYLYCKDKFGYINVYHGR